MPRHPAPKADLTHPPLSVVWRRLLRRRLLHWFAENARDLPWRKSRNPYRIWVSEIMLQQTQVATVEPYFRRFIKAFPTVRALARADEQQVLRLWEGLGYYRRARQMHQAAQTIVAEHKGRFPTEIEAVLRLPGIGRYTAGAILSIALDVRVPIIEANTLRLWSRLLAFRGDPRSAAGQRMLWDTAEQILPRRHVGQLNQALMELGSLVCTPRDPSCQACPLATLCAARAGGLQHKIPRSAPKQSFLDVREAAVVVRKRGQVLLRRCGSGERWAGLWDFPRFTVDVASRTAAESEVVEKVRQQTGVLVESLEHLTTIKHGVTRYRITLDCHVAKYVSGRTRSGNGAVLKWVQPAALADYPLSTTGRKLARLVWPG